MGQLTDKDIREIINDPRFDPKSDYKLLSPQDQVRFQELYRETKLKTPAPARPGEPAAKVPAEPGRWERAMTSTLDTAKNVGTGFAKGAGETAVTLGRGVNAVAEPMGNALMSGILQMQGVPSERISPPVHRDMNAAYDDLEAHGTGEQVGKMGEQVAEYLLPAGAARKAAVEGLVRFGIPNSASAKTMSVLNKLYAIIGRSVGEGGSAAAVAGLHGEAKPEHEGMMAAAIPLATELLAKGITPAAWLAPYYVGGKAGKIMTGIGGIAGGIGTTSAARQTMRRALDPSMVTKLQQFVRSYGPSGLRALVGLYEQQQTKPGNVERELNDMIGTGR